MRPHADQTASYLRLQALERPSATTGTRFGLIVPPSPYVVPTGWEFVHTAPFEGPSIIATLIRALGCEVDIVDQRDTPDVEALRGGALERFDLLGVATYSDSFPFQRQAVAIAKRERPDRPVILGGPTVTSVPRVYMEATEADYAVLGEGELTTIELLDHLLGRPGALPLEQILGLAYRRPDGTVVVNPPRPQMLDLDAVPIPDLTLWPRVRATGQAPEVYAQASRGCPMSCSFCYRAMPKLAYKSPARMRAELLAYKRLGARFVWWNDLTFVVDQARVVRLMDAIQDLGLRWSCFTRVVGVDVPVLTKMRDAGCDIVMYGFESITQSILDAYGKGATAHHVTDAIQATRTAGLKVGGLFIIGAPGETEASLQALVLFCEQFKEVTRVKYLSLLPGTPEYRSALERGVIKDEVEHLVFMARERAIESDEIVNVCGLDEALLRSIYRRINDQIRGRPYEYWNPQNRYTAELSDYASRPVPSLGGGGGSLP